MTARDVLSRRRRSLLAVGALLAAAVAGGVREFALLVIMSEADDPAPPCGMCRQALVEFAPRLPIVSYTKHGTASEWNLAALLPQPFTPAALTHHQ